MDTINTMATAAAKAVWGENAWKEEPVNGQTGNVAKGEPYDAGNLGGKISFVIPEGQDVMMARCQYVMMSKDDGTVY